MIDDLLGWGLGGICGDPCSSDGVNAILGFDQEQTVLHAEFIHIGMTHTEEVHELRIANQRIEVVGVAEEPLVPGSGIEERYQEDAHVGTRINEDAQSISHLIFNGTFVTFFAGNERSIRVIEWCRHDHGEAILLTEESSQTILPGLDRVDHFMAVSTHGGTLRVFWELGSCQSFCPVVFLHCLYLRVLVGRTKISCLSLFVNHKARALRRLAGPSCGPECASSL